MCMDMDFPHPRHAVHAGSNRADYSALVASATSRQATSRTVSALLSAPLLQLDDADVLGSRIAFFAKTDRNVAVSARGAFWMIGPDQIKSNPVSTILNAFELPVNLAGLTNSNSDQSLTVNPEYQVAERGTEL